MPGRQLIELVDSLAIQPQEQLAQVELLRARSPNPAMSPQMLEVVGHHPLVEPGRLAVLEHLGAQREVGLEQHAQRRANMAGPALAALGARAQVANDNRVVHVAGQRCALPIAACRELQPLRDVLRDGVGVVAAVEQARCESIDTILPS